MSSTLVVPASVSAPTLQILDRGFESYAVTYAAMREFTDLRAADTPDQLWIVEHAPVYTLGLGAEPAHVLEAGSIPVIQTDRGGEVTYHGPGQAIVYLMIDLRRGAPGARLYAREFVCRIEQAVIDTLAAYNLKGERHAGAPGIYVSTASRWQGAKIAALGLKVRGNGCTYHGVALNVAMDLRPFSGINPCGFRGLETVDMATLDVTVALAEIQMLLSKNLQHNLSNRSALAPAIANVAAG